MTQVDDGPGRASLRSPLVMLSDAELLNRAIEKIPLKPVNVATLDVIYQAFGEAKAASDSWNKYYMISVALLIMASSHALSEFSIFGEKIDVAFLPSAAVMYFCVCTLTYMNHEMKMRFYRTFFRKQLDQAQGAERVQILIRYPLAFYGAEYAAYELRGSSLAFGTNQAVRTIPLLAALLLGKAAAVFGLMGLILYVLFQMMVEPAVPILIKVMVGAFFIGTMVVGSGMLRNPKKKFGYEPIP